MLTRFAQILALAFLFTSWSACSPIHYGEQEIFVRHDAKADTLDMLIVYDAIQSEPQDDKDGIDIGREFAANVSSGRREFMIYDWPLHFDLERLLHEGDEPAGDTSDPVQVWKRELLAQLKDLSVAESGCLSGTQERLGLYQHFKLPNAGRVVALFNRCLLMVIEQEASDGSFERETPWLDARSREMWIALAREKKLWLSLKDGVLTAELPATNACAARMVGVLTQSSADKTGTAHFIAGLFSHLSELKIADEHVLLRWNLSGPTWTFSPPTGLVYDDTLAKSLRAAKASTEKLPARNDVSAGFGKH